jgi:hypothetical protein
MAPTLIARLLAPVGAVTAPAVGLGDQATVDESAAPATRAAVSGDVGLAAAVTADGEVAPGETQVWDLPADGAGQWVVAGPGAARVVFLDRAGKPLQDDELDAPEGEERSITAPSSAARMAVSTVGQSGPKVAGWQSGTLLTQVGRTALLAPGASVHLSTPLLTRRQGQPTAQALVRAGDIANPADTITTRLPADTETVVVVLDAAPGTDPSTVPPITIDGSPPPTAPTVVASGHRLHLVYEVEADDTRTNVEVRVDTGTEWHLAGVLGGQGRVDDWLPAITAPGSGVAIATPEPAAPVTVRFQASDAEEAS